LVSCCQDRERINFGEVISISTFDRNEIVTWSDRLKSADPQIQERFVKTLKRSPGLFQLETQDPNLAQALLP
jgi:hypothetical protein